MLQHISVSCVRPICGLSAFCLWLAAVAPAAGQDAAQLQAELDKSRAVIQQLQAERAALQAELAKAGAVAQQMQAQVAQLQAELAQSRATIKVLELKRDDELRRRVMEADAKARAAKPPADNRPPKPEDLPPKVDGVIRAIQGEMIEISLGSDDGLKKGHHLDIYRVVDGQGIYVGRMELIKTAATASVGKMLPGSGKHPQKGDRVATRM